MAIAMLLVSTSTSVLLILQLTR